MSQAFERAIGPATEAQGPTLEQVPEALGPTLEQVPEALAPVLEAPAPPQPSDFKQRFRAMTDTQLSEAWATERNPMVRKVVTELMETRDIWPAAQLEARDKLGGLYPDPDDPNFGARLYQKREFYESRAIVAQVADGTLDPCTSAAEAVFELTPVQRLVSRFMHPLTPYQGLLLFHGVGVGKTCSAVTMAEQFLEVAPTQKVIVLVPQAIQENFKKTVFDASKLKWVGDRWSSNQCTGVSYLERLGLLKNPDLKAVQFAVETDRRKRYTITGYQAFANWIDRNLANHVPAGLVGAAKTVAENEVLRRLFSDHMIIVDEAHNLRDLSEDAEDSVVGGEAAENAGGKALNPFLKRIVLNAEGLRLVFMTATPMYNSAPEILRLLNYLLMNDAKTDAVAMAAEDIFTATGEVRNAEPLERAARRYVSYMRGENPYTFPLRLRSAASPPIVGDNTISNIWPTVSATKKPIDITEADAAALNVLPLVFTEPLAGSKVEEQLRAATSRGGGAAETIGGEGASELVPEVGRDTMLDLRMQIANITYPNNLYGTVGWDTHFNKQTVTSGSRKIRVFSPKDNFDVDSVFGSGLEACCPKIHRILDNIKKARGICFAYSRYIKAGALPMAIALERAGFQRKLSDGRVAPLLTGLPPVAPVCAICNQVAATHTEAHPFSPAYYVLLTSEDDISPDFPGLVRMATQWTDPVWGPLGTSVKVVLGSQVASEGLDLKCVREMHILDSWYHLNRTDQIIGRAIRYCSHSALRATEKHLGLAPMSYNNCTIYLHAAIVRDRDGQPGFETADMYAYRLAIRKAQMVGRVQRLLKKNAWDCSLEMDAIVFTTLPPRVQIDAQGNEYPEYSANDQDYTTYCDYQVCKHECAVALPKDLELDTSTYGVADARRAVMAKLDIVRHLFDDQVMVPDSMIHELFHDMPWEISSEAFRELIDGRRFRLIRDGIEGYLIKRAGFLIFQPLAADTEIPMALRYARAFQIQRKFMAYNKPVLGTFTGKPSVAAPSIGLSTVPSLTPGVPMSSVETRWSRWLAFVDGGALPDDMPTTMRIWSWIREHFSLVPEMRSVALRWWFDKVNYKDQRVLFELALAGNAELESVLRRDILRTSTMAAYRIYNPDTMMAEYICRSGSGFGPCPSNIAAVIEKALGSKPTVIPGEAGTLLGFLASKSGALVFKSLDTTKPIKSKSGGAECGNTSNLDEHHPRIRLLHAAGRTDELMGPLIIPEDYVDEHDKAGAKKRMSSLKPAYVADITHQPLCLYMEVLCRLLDARRLGGRRWFLGPIEAVAAGLRGKK